MTDSSTTASLEVTCVASLLLVTCACCLGFIKDYSVSCVGCITVSARLYAATGIVCSIKLFFS